MSEKLQQAITSIKAGDQQTGRQLLAQILQAEPNNETAWLWMSAVVDEDKRRYCIERVLRINPQNQSALRALGKLKEMGTESTTVSPPSHAQPTPHTQIHSTIEPEISPPAITKKAAAEAAQTIDAYKPPGSIVETAAKDGLKLGILAGIIGLPLPILGILTPFIQLFLIGLNFIAVLCFSAGIATGVVFFRRRIGSNISVSLGGGISGFVSAAIWSLALGHLFFNPELNVLGISTYILFCGLFFPFLAGIVGAITIWIPRIFINPNKHAKTQPTVDPDEPTRTPQKISHPKQKREEMPAAFPQTAPQPSAATAAPLPALHDPPKTSDDALETVGLKFWINPTRSKANIFILLEHEIVLAVSKPEILPLVQISLLNGNIPKDVFTDRENIPFNKITTVSRLMASITIEHNEGSGEASSKLDCKDGDMADAILDEIEKRLGPRFERTSAPLKAGSSIAASGIFMLIVFACSAFLYYGAWELETGSAGITGSARVRGILRLLELIGTQGVLCIGGLLLLALLGMMIYLIVKPPMITKLTIKDPPDLG